VASDPTRYLTGAATGGGGFNSLAAGPKRYGVSGLQTPNLGPTQDPLGYMKRDRETAARRNLALKQMQFQNNLKFKVM
jgi:hypothetical protein